VLLFVVFAFGATGYLLPWDQAAYWTVTEALDVVERVPLVGGLLVEVLRGDPIVSGATLSRFFAVHVILLPWLAMGLLMLHFALVRKHGIAPGRGAVPEGPGVPFFPQQLLRSFVVGALVVALVITGAALYPRDVGDPANPSQVPGTLPSSWVVADVSRGLTYYLGAWGFGAFLVLGIALALLPLFDRDPERRLRRRPAVAALGAVFFLGFIAAWLVGRQLRSVPPRGPVAPGVFVQPPPPVPTTRPEPAARTPDSVPRHESVP